MIDTRIKSLLIIIISQSIALNGSAPKKRASKMLPFLIAKQQLHATRENNKRLKMLLAETGKSNEINAERNRIETERNRIAAETVKALQEQNRIHLDILSQQDALLKRSAEPSSPTSMCATPNRTPLSAGYRNLSAAAQTAAQIAMEATPMQLVSLSASTPNLKGLARSSKTGGHKKSATLPLATIPSPAHTQSAANGSAIASATASTDAEGNSLVINIAKANE